MKVNYFFNLLKEVILGLIKNKAVIVIFSLIIILNAILNFSSILMFQISSLKYSNIKTITNFFLIPITLLLTLFILTISIKIFKEDYDEKIIILEKRFGYSNIEIYFSRIISFFIIFFSLILTMLLINTIVYFVSAREIVYKSNSFISLGWYSVFGIIFFSAFLVITFFVKPMITMIIGIFVSLSLLLSIVSLSFLSVIRDDEGKILNIDESLIVKTISKQEIDKPYFFDESTKAIYDNAENLIKKIQTFYKIDQDDNNELAKIFLAGPAFWDKEILDSEKDSPYMKMIEYFHTKYKIIRLESNWIWYDFFYPLKGKNKDTRNFLNFLKDTRSDYFFTYELMKMYVEYFYFFNYYNEFGTGIDPAMEVKDIVSLLKKYRRYDEFLFFQTLNRLFFYRHQNLKYSFNEYFEPFNDYMIKSSNKNLINPIGHLSLMFFGRGYHKDELFLQILNKTNLMGQLLNLKIEKTILSNGNTNYEFKESVNVIGLYIGYTFIGITLLCLMYFAFRRKIIQ